MTTQSKVNHNVGAATAYFRNRLDEMSDDWSIAGFKNMVVGRNVWGLQAIFKYSSQYGDQFYQSVYVFEEYRNSGMMSDHVSKSKSNDIPFITMTDCGIHQWFAKRKIPFLMVC